MGAVRDRLRALEVAELIVGLPEISEPDFTKLVEMVKAYAEAIVSGEYDEGDSAYIFEEAVEAVYGKKAFEHLNRFLR